MKVHSTNYENTFIEVAEDTKASSGETPTRKGDKPTVATMQFEMINNNPYKYTSDDVFFTVFANRKGITESEQDEARRQFFSKGQPCFRASPLTKLYGWGVHSDAEGKVAIYAMGSNEYESFIKDNTVKKIRAMKSKR